ncbi:MAG: thiamine-phosphate kinase [Vicinamibacteria bacterium]|nr:thiamine-phosphate kinase [Vicinamibacteria bacterium]
MTGVGGPGSGVVEDATVSAFGEHALIDRIRRRLPPAPDWLIVDVGDDAAVYEPVRNRLEVITTDAVVDGVHVDRRFVPAGAIGHRAVAVNLSDLAAMGATPRLLTLSLALPDDLSLSDFDALVDGALALAERAGARLVGGNITRSRGPLMVDVTAVGSVHRRRILRRSGARPGDYVFVSGTLGDARAGLALLADPSGAHAEAWPDVVARYLRPEPRLRLGQVLGRSRAPTAALDLSDGLADGLARLTADHGLGCEIDATALPMSASATAVWQSRGADPVAEAVTGGDDYELAFTVRPKESRRLGAVIRAVGGLRLTRIGVVTRDAGCWLVDAERQRSPIGRGYEHFSR